MPSTKVSSFNLEGLAKRAALAGLVSMVLVSGAFHDAFVAHARAAALDASPAAATADARARTTPAPAKARKVASLADAVDAHLLDPKVAKRLRAGESLDVLVSFAFKAVNRAAEIEAPKGKKHDKAVVTGMRKGFGAMKDRTLKGAGLEVLREYPNLPTAFVRVKNQQAVLRLLRDPDVLGISLPLRYDPAGAEPGLVQIRQPEVKAAGNTGSNTYVAVLDSGIDYTRQAFGSCSAPGGSCKVSELIDKGDNDIYLDDSPVVHGTNVAGIVLDVAPSTRIIGYDVFRYSGLDAQGNRKIGAADQDITAALNDVIAKSATRTIAAVNLSIGWDSQYNNSVCGTAPSGVANPYTGIVDSLRTRDIAPVFSAGNDAVYGSSFVEGVTYPGCTAGAIRVGAVWNGSYGYQDWEPKSNHGCYDPVTSIDKVTCFSQNSRNMVSLLAPGANVNAGGISLRGTSQAAPHVAGAFAVLRGARPAATLEYLSSAILNNGPQVTDTRFPGITITKRRLDLAAALASVKADATAPSFTLTPRVGFTTGATLGTDGSTSVDVDWAATDANGIASYAIQIGVTGGSWIDKTTALSSPKATSLTFSPMVAGTQYWVQVAARDKAGNWTAWKVLGPFTISVIDQTSTSIVRSTGWTTMTYNPAYRGSVSVTSTAGAWTTYTFSGRAIAFAGTSGSNRGKATVTTGTLAAVTVNENASTLGDRKVQYGAKGLNPAVSTTMRVTNSATAGTPNFDVDAILIIK